MGLNFRIFFVGIKSTMTNSKRPIYYFSLSLFLCWKKTDHERSLNLRKPNGEFLNNRNTNWNIMNSTHVEHRNFLIPSQFAKSFKMDRVQVYNDTQTLSDRQITQRPSGPHVCECIHVACPKCFE